MKILFINNIAAYGKGGGSQIAAVRIFNAMLEIGVNVDLGVLTKEISNEHIFELPQNPNLEADMKKISNDKLLQTTNSAIHFMNRLSKASVEWINESDYDIVHIHHIVGSVLSIEDIAKIKKPIVWTMHDSWIFCGAEQHPNVLENDIRFEQGYYENNFPTTSSRVNICRLTWERKKKAWKDVKFNFISVSNHHAQCLNKSALFKGQAAKVIPNIIPNIFKPQKVTEFKKILNIPLYRKIIGFGAVGDINGKKSIKGSWYLIKALERLKNKEDYFAVIFGPASGEFLGKMPIKYFASGSIGNESFLSVFYNMLDVFVCPSIIENLPNVCVEAMFCGVPVTAFETGGIPDIVKHKKTGYLAKPFVASDLARGIEFCLGNQKELSRNSLKRAKSDYFSEKFIVEEHLKVYREIFNSIKKNVVE